MATGDIRIDALLQDGWGLSTGLSDGVPLEVSYRFMESLESPEEQSELTEPVFGFQPMLDDQRQAVRNILESAFTQVGARFHEVGPDEPAMLRFGLSAGMDGSGDDTFEVGYAMYQGPNGLEPIVMINHLKAVFQGDPAGLAFQDVILHEIGHALGLKHPGKYFEHENGPFLPEELDTTNNTVMSYHYEEGAWNVTELGPFDLLALQHIYGPDVDNLGVSPTVEREINTPDYITVGSAANDVIYFEVGPRGEYAKSVFTSWGDDRLHINVDTMEPWDRVIFQGGEGVDTLMLNEFYQHARSLIPDDSVIQFQLVDDHEERHFDLESVERVQFLDMAVALDVDETSGQAYRIYKAAFAREPDQAGLGYWINEMDRGASVTEVASSFLDSEEFTQRYGLDVDDTTFIDALYVNVLGRQQDSAGFGFWLNELEMGAGREQVLASFSESPENVVSVADLIGEGIVYDPWLA